MNGPDEASEQPRHRPLAPVLIGVAVGIALDGVLEPPAWHWLVVCAIGAAGAAWGIRRGLRPWGYWLLAVILAVCVGGFYHRVRFRQEAPWHLKNLALREGGIYYLKGHVVREAQRRYHAVSFRDSGGPLSTYFVFRMRLDGISGDARRWSRTAGNVSVFTEGAPPDVRVGDRVQLLGLLRRGRAPTNPGQRDLEMAYQRAGSYGSVSVGSAEAVRVLERAPWYHGLTVALGRLRSVMEQRLDAYLTEHNARRESGLIKALMFGDRGALTPEQSELLKSSGTVHFLAISGLHVGIFCLFIGYLLALLNLPVRLRHILTILLVWGYVLFTGFHVSAVRAGWMLTLMLAAPVLERQTDSLSALMGAALIILLVSPQQLFTPGFQLTFVAVWALVCIYPDLEGVLWPWRDFLAAVQSPEQRSIWRDLWNWGRSYLMLSFTVWLAVAPILVYHFHYLNFMTPLLNLLIWPLVLCLLLVVFALLISLSLGGWMIGLLAPLALILTGDINTVLSAADRLPGTPIYLSSPPLWWIGLFYLALALWATRRRLLRGRWAFVTVVLILALSFVWNDAAVRVRRPFHVVLADVGHGQAAIVELPGGEVLMLDAGSSQAGAGGAVSDMLLGDHVDYISAAVISHANTEHCSFLPMLVRRFGVGKVVLPPQTGSSALRDRLGELLRRRAIPRWRLHEGDSVTGGGLRCEVLHPDERFAAGGAYSANDSSLVLYCRYRELSFIVPGDIGAAGIERLVKSYGPRLAADLLVMPHHGRYEAGLDELLDCVRPAAALVSGTDEDLDPRTRDLLHERGVPLWTTSLDGAIIVGLLGAKGTVLGYASGRRLEFDATSR
ncbi:MAG: ComEC/Rec2 family competence protein [Planctomycetes bacterium]|nr:ComEC/Rec2 family competence protein [Planctomycetota bacterium]